MIGTGDQQPQKSRSHWNYENFFTQTQIQTKNYRYSYSIAAGWGRRWVILREELATAAGGFQLFSSRFLVCLSSFFPSASPHPHTSFASRPAYERISSLESSSPALPSTRLQPPLPAPSSAPAADVCDHTVLPHPRSPFLSYLLYATLNNDHNTRSLLQRFGGMLTPRPLKPPHCSSKPADCWPTCSARGNKGWNRLMSREEAP